MLFGHAVRIDPWIGIYMAAVSKILDALFGRRTADDTGPLLGRIPDGERVYAIGDIHGRFDLLRQLHADIAADRKGDGQKETVIYLGDYIDRGVDSPQVIDFLLDLATDGDVKRICLLGNHEAMLLGFLDNPQGAGRWLTNGGQTTLHAYGVASPRVPAAPADMETARQALRERLPAAHLNFLQDLKLCHQIGDYYFVHAGVRPGVPLGQQVKEDMIWIRNEFLDAQDDFSKIIVHGHSIRAKVEERPNRIGIDTGAYMSGTLTALVLEGDQRRYLST
jgi:serine/threonine protein phosphatase 1